MFLGSGEWIDGWRRRLSAELVREGGPLQRERAWHPILDHVVGAVSEAFGAEPADLRVSRRHGNEARSAAIYLARHQTDTVLRAIRAYFGGVSPAAISKAVARMDSRTANKLARHSRSRVGGEWRVASGQRQVSYF